MCAAMHGCFDYAALQFTSASITLRCISVAGVALSFKKKTVTLVCKHPRSLSFPQMAWLMPCAQKKHHPQGVLSSKMVLISAPPGARTLDTLIKRYNCNFIYLFYGGISVCNNVMAIV